MTEQLRLLGMGMAVPDKVMANEDFEKIVDTSDAWIRERTGIRERRFIGDGSLTELAAEASRKAIARAGIAPEEIGLVICATATPERAVPATACMLQKMLCIPAGTPAFDINAACTGFIYAMAAAQAMLPAIRGKYALLIGAEEVSKLLDMAHRRTCVLFGDGAGSAVDGVTGKPGTRVRIFADGYEEALSCGGYGGEDRHLRMDGRKVFRFAVSRLEGEIRALEEETGIPVSGIDYVICHQANARILDHVRRKFGLPEEKLYVNLDRYGNTSAASIPIALAEMAERGMLAPGKRAFAVGFGAGLTWGSCYLEF